MGQRIKELEEENNRLRSGTSTELVTQPVEEEASNQLVVRESHEQLSSLTRTVEALSEEQRKERDRGDALLKLFWSCMTNTTPSCTLCSNHNPKNTIESRPCYRGCLVRLKWTQCGRKKSLPMRLKPHRRLPAVGPQRRQGTCAFIAQEA